MIGSTILSVLPAWLIELKFAGKLAPMTFVDLAIHLVPKPRQWPDLRDGSVANNAGHRLMLCFVLALC